MNAIRKGTAAQNAIALRTEQPPEEFVNHLILRACAKSKNPAIGVFRMTRSSTLT
jgi:hypothetical protein